MSSVPILVLAWRRPELTERLLEAISAWQPERLFLACDGWDPDSPAALVADVQATREVLERQPAWSCEVQRHYADHNLGLRTAVSEAIEWFFAHCEEGIILEDDCIPSPELLPYCTDLLERYRHDSRVMCISGDGSAEALEDRTESYAFIRFPLIWGWATWRRAWAHYDRDLDRAAALDDVDWEDRLPDPVERRVWRERLESLRNASGPDTWDYVWTLSTIVEGGLTIIPAVNLVENAGFGPGATHTTAAVLRPPVPTRAILPLTHPNAVVLDVAASSRVFDVALGGADERRRFVWERTLQGRLRVLLARWVTRRLPARLRRRGRPPWLGD